MPFDDVRAFIKRLEEEGELVQVKQEVDWNEEMGAIGRRINELSLPAVMFQRVKDYPKWRVAGGLMSAIRRVAIAMDLPADSTVQTLKAEFLKRTGSPIKPVLVKTGPCKENILWGRKRICLHCLLLSFMRETAGDTSAPGILTSPRIGIATG